jgi:hypothetical protein
VELVDQIGLVILSGTVLWVLSILLVDVYEVPFSKLRNGIEALWFLLTVPMQRREPLEADHTRIAELEHWNRTWSHPEIGDFYMWDGSSYVETSWKKTDSGLEYYTDRNTWITTVRSTGMTLGSWCRSCKSPAHGAEYCRRCVDNYGYREGKKRYKLPNGCYVDTYEETLCEVCTEPLPLYWSRICSMECGRKLEELEEPRCKDTMCVNRTKTTCKDCCEDTGHTIGGRCGKCHWDHRYGRKDRCKDTMCGGYGTVYRDGRCKGCYEVRMKERRCAWCGNTKKVQWSGDDGHWFCNALCPFNYQTEP